MSRPTSQPRKTSQVALARVNPQKTRDMSPTSQPRKGNHGGTMSPKAAKLLGLFQKNIQIRFRKRTVPLYLANVSRFTSWLEARGVELTQVRTDDILAYQSDLYSARKANGKPYSVSAQAGFLIS